MADARRAWAKALHRALVAAAGGSRAGEMAEADLEAAAIALEAVAAAMDGRAGSKAEAFFLDPDIPRRERSAALASLFVGGSSAGAEVFARFTGLLVEKGRVGLIPAIARAFRKLLDRERGIERLELSSARELDPKTREAIGEAWKLASGATTVLVTAKQDPALLGGFILRAGSVRYDWSTAGRFRRLGEELARPLEPRSLGPAGE